MTPSLIHTYCRQRAGLPARRWGHWLLLLLGLWPLTSHAQLTVTGRTPARNTNTASRTGNVVLTFSQALNAATAGNVRMFSSQKGGQLVRGGNATASGSTLTIVPATSFRPGETVLVTVPATVTSSGGTAATNHVYQFTAAAGVGPASYPGTGTDPAVGAVPYAVAVGDVNNDGYLDLLTANRDGNSVSIRLNDGTGAFSGTGSVGVGNSPRALAVGDVNGDGNLDVVTANYGGSSVSVCLNNGSGGFTLLQTISTGGGTYGVALGDVDGDGILDVVTANLSGNTASVSLNNGTGTSTSFGTATTVSVDNSPVSVALGDVNNDGYLDLLTANNLVPGTVSVRLNNGAGVFSGSTNVTVDNTPIGLVLGDLNGDGFLDFATSNNIGGGGSVSIGLNNGSGGFGATTNVAVAGEPWGMALGDVNGDGKLDFVTANLANNTASIRLNNGAGVFSGGSNVTAGTGPRGVALADVDGDGRLDLLVANGGSSTVKVRLNTTPPVLPAPTLTSISPSAVTVGATVTLTGTNFDNSSTVSFGGTAATSVTVNSSTSISVVVPAGTTAGNVTVTTTTGTSAGLPYTMATLATVTTAAATTVTSTSATLGGTVTADGGATVTERGVAYSVTNTLPDVTVDPSASSGTGLGSYTVNPSGLTPGTLYYMRAYAINSVGTAYGAVVQFTTVTPPTLTSLSPASGPVGTSVTLTGTAFSNTSTVSFNGTAATSVTFNSATSLTALVPTGATTGPVTVSNGSEVSNGIVFTVPGPPSVSTSAGVAGTTATLGGNVTSDNTQPVTERGVVYSTSTNPPTVADTKLVIGSGTGSYSQTVSGLPTSTTYYVRAYAINSLGTSYGSLRTITTGATPTATITGLNPTSGTVGSTVIITGTGFLLGGNNVRFNGTLISSGSTNSTTQITAVVPNGATTGNVTVNNANGTSNGVLFTVVSAPVVSTTTPATSIVYNGATLGGNVTNDGSLTVTERGILYSKTSIPPTMADSKAVMGSGTGVFAQAVTGLDPSSNYYYRAYAINSLGTSYGNTYNFFTTAAPANLPTVSSLSNSNGPVGTVVTIGGSNFVVGGSTVTFNGTAATTFTVNSATSITATVPAGATTGFVNVTTSVGTSQNTLSFTVLIPATLTTAAATTITATGATLGGNVTADNGGTVSERGVVYSTISTVPTTGNDTKLAIGSGTGAYSQAVTGLTPFTTYYVRAYAFNNGGTGYGPVVQFMTAAAVPTLTSLNPAAGPVGTSVALTGTEFISGSTVSFGGTAATSVTINSRTSITALVPAGLASGSVSVSVTTAGGTSAGVSFTVTAPATVTTAAATAITTTTATLGGNVTNDGAATVTERGVVYSTSNAVPTTTDTKVAIGTGTGAFSQNVTGLTNNTLYYVRAYAINNQGTSYGAVQQFTTPPVPVLTSLSPTSGVRASSVTLTGTGFTAASTVSFGGTAASVTYNSPTSLTAVVPISLSAPGSVLVSVSTVNGTSNGIYYNVRTVAVLTDAPTAITTTSATLGGNADNTVPVGAAGGPYPTIILERGVVYVPGTGTPTIADTKVAMGPGPGSFSQTVTGLTAATTYTVRAYATNSVDTDYGPARTFSTVTPPPTLTSLSPTTGPVGQSVTLTGTYFTSGSAVSFNGTAATSVTVNSATSITAVVPSGATAGNVTVTTPNGTTSGLSFTVEVPTLTSLSPTKGPVGTPVTLTGTYFTNASTVSFNGTAATSVTFNSATSLTATVPTGATTGNVVVSNVSGTTSGAAFTVTRLPTVTTAAATNIQAVAATLGGNLTDNGEDPATSYGVVRSSTNPVPTTADQLFQMGSNGATGPYSNSNGGFAPSTTYYVRAYATNGAGTAYGSVVQFTTPASSVTLTSLSATRGVLGSNLTLTGTNFTPTFNTVFFNYNNGTGTRATSVTYNSPTSLTVVVPFSNIYGSAVSGNVVVQNNNGESNVLYFIVVPAVVNTDIPTAITTTSATLGGNVTSSLGNVTERGVVYVQGAYTPYLYNSKVVMGSGLGSFSQSVTGLLPNTLYTVRAYATQDNTNFSSDATGYGDSQTFTTPAAVPVLTSLSPTTGPVGQSVTLTGSYFTNGSTVSFNGTPATSVTFNSTTSLTATVPVGATPGNVTVTAPAGTSNGVNFAVQVPTLTSVNPTAVSVNQTVALTGTNFTSGSTVSVNGTPVTNVTFNSSTTLYIVVQNSNTSGLVTVTTPSGTSNGVNLVIKRAPTVITALPTAITNTGATLGGNMTTTGGSYVYANGVVYSSVNAAPTTTDSRADVGTGVGSYSVTVTGLTPNTTYYARAYASSDEGYSYGVVYTFTTTSPGGPTLTSLSPTSGSVGTPVTLTGTGFTNGSTVRFNGTASSVFLNSATSLTATVPTGATTGNVTVTTVNGTSGVLLFTVTEPATVTTATPTAVGNTGATLGGVVTAEGSSGVSERGVVYVPGTGAPTTADTKVPIGSGLGSFSQAISGLNTGTQYTVRAYAINSTNTSYGSSQVFTTTGTPAPDLTISTGSLGSPVSIAAGTYNNVTITGTGFATMAGAVAVNGTLSVAGSLDTNCQALTGSGSFTLAAGATLAVCDAAGLSATGATGAVQVTGARSFSTDASYVYNGTVAQTTGAALPGTVRALTLTNAAGLTLSQDLTATTALTVTAGVLTTGTRRATLAAGAALSETETAYVVGKVVATRTLAPGTAETFGGLGLTLTPAAGSVAPGATPVVRTTGTALTGAGSSVSVLRNFDIQPAVNAGLNVTMTFSYFAHELNNIPLANLALFKSDNGAAGPWVPQRPVTLNAAANTVSKAGITGFSLWTLGNGANPLPVELTAFAAERQGEAARLTWATASEKNSAYFEAEASADGRAFRPVGRLAAQGSTAQRHEYQLSDPRLLTYGAPLVYYRLRQVDLDGTASYSPVRAVAVGNSLAAFRAVAWPNPAGAGRPVQLLVSGPATDQPLELTLTDAAGRVLARRQVPAAEAAAGPLALPETADRPAGVYLLVVRQGSAQQVLRLLRE